MVKNTEDKPLAQNKKARHDYEIYETFEAGIVLTGTEIKSVRQAKIQLKDGFARVVMEKFGYQMFILLLLSRAIFLMLKNCVRGNYY